MPPYQLLLAAGNPCVRWAAGCVLSVSVSSSRAVLASVSVPMSKFLMETTVTGLGSTQIQTDLISLDDAGKDLTSKQSCSQVLGVRT